MKTVLWERWKLKRNIVLLDLVWTAVVHPIYFQTITTTHPFLYITTTQRLNKKVEKLFTFFTAKNSPIEGSFSSSSSSSPPVSEVCPTQVPMFSKCDTTVTNVIVCICKDPLAKKITFDTFGFPASSLIMCWVGGARDERLRKEIGRYAP